MKRFHINKKFTDVNLICTENETEYSIACHKLVLSAFSSYFLGMFSSNLVENTTNKVILPNTDYSTLTEIINYAYSGTINLNITNVQNIFVVASLFCLKELVQACSDYMLSQLDINNSIDVFCFAKHHMCDELMLKSKEFINQNINEIFKTNEFLLVDDFNLLYDLMSSDDLNVQSEESILLSLVEWVDYNYNTRHIHFEKIFNTIRINQIDRKYLLNFQQENKELLSDKCQQLIKDYVTNTTNNTSNKRIGMTKPDYVFLLLGGNCDLEDGFYVNCVNPHTGDKYFVSRNFLEKSKSIKKGFFHLENPGVCVTEDDRIFISGGNFVYHEYKLYNQDPSKRKNKTSSISNQNNSTAEKDNFTDGEEILSKETYEYDKLNDNWIRRSNMLFAKSNFTLCSLRERIYSFGGITTDQDQLDIVEYYDITQNIWQYVGKMPTAFIAGNVVQHKDSFFILGGRSGVGRFNKCWQFKPDTCEWLEISKMKIGRFNFGACALNDKIYVFGGQRYNESEQSYYTREALDSVEIYDTQTQEWSLGNDTMPNPLYNTGVCIYDDKNKCVYVCGTTECKYSGNTLLGFMFTSVFRLEFLREDKMKWTVVEHDLSDIKSNYRCIAAKLNTRKLYKCNDQ